MVADARAVIVSTARDFVSRAVPYVLGGTSRDGTDCSGLVQIAYADAGISMPRVTYDQIKACHPIAAADVMPGDLLFFTFDPNDRFGHVAIYSGTGHIIEEPTQGMVAREILLDEHTGYVASLEGYYRHPALDAPGPAPAAALVAGTLAHVDADEGLRLRSRGTKESALLVTMLDHTPVLVGPQTAQADNLTWRQVAVVAANTLLVGWCDEEFLKAG